MSDSDEEGAFQSADEGDVKEPQKEKTDKSTSKPEQIPKNQGKGRNKKKRGKGQKNTNEVENIDKPSSSAEAEQKERVSASGEAESKDVASGEAESKDVNRVLKEKEKTDMDTLVDDPKAETSQETSTDKDVKDETVATVVEQPHRSERPGEEEEKVKHTPASALDKLTEEEEKVQSYLLMFFRKALLITVDLKLFTFLSYDGNYVL